VGVMSLPFGPVRVLFFRFGSVLFVPVALVRLFAECRCLSVVLITFFAECRFLSMAPVAFCAEWRFAGEAGPSPVDGFARTIP
jgi:hypothetical protein